jgi:hypothetical protein
VVKMFARIYAQCGSERESVSINQELMQALSDYGAVAVEQPVVYWKISEYYGFRFRFAVTTDEAFEGLMSLASGAWFQINSSRERSAVWNYTDNIQFLIPEVRWAELQLFDEAPSV